MERKYKEQLIIAVIVVLVLLVSGTFLFSILEGWGYVDSFYFTGVTLTTLGYGDLVPTTSSSKVTTVLFSMIGIGLVLYSVTLIARLMLEQEQQQIESLLQRRLRQKLAEEQKLKEAAEKEAEEKAKAVEKEAVKIAKEISKK